MKLNEIREKISNHKSTNRFKKVPMILLGRIYGDHFVVKGKERTFVVKDNKTIKEFVPEFYDSVNNLLEIEISLTIKNNSLSRVTDKTYSELAELFRKNRELETIEKEVEFFISIS